MNHIDPNRLSASQWAMMNLSKSGITMEEFDAMGGRILDTDASFMEILSFMSQCGSNPVEGYAFPYHDHETGMILEGDDGLPFWRVRLRYPATRPEGAKYLSRKGSGIRAFVTQKVAKMLEDPEVSLFLVEGEKKALAMASADLAAIGIAGVTCWNIPGTAELLPQIAEFLSDSRTVVFVQDSDMRENPHAQKNQKRLANTCFQYGATLRSIILPAEGTEKVGADDYIVDHGAVAFKAVIQTAEIVRPDGRLAQKKGRKITAAEAAAAVSKVFAGPIPGDAPSLAYWRGNWYRRQAHGGYRKISQAALESEVTSQFLSFAPESVNRHLVSDILALFRSRAYFYLPEEVNPPFYFVNALPLPSSYIAVENGYIDSEATEKGIQVHHTQIFGTRVLPVRFDPAAECPVFMRYLATSLPESESRRQVQLMMGLCLVPDTSFNVMFFLYDPQGGSGRSVLLKVIRRLLGEENVSMLSLDQLGGAFVGEELTGALVNIVDDLPARFTRQRSVPVDILKSLTSGAPIRINRKHQQETENRLATARIIVATNYLPAFTESDRALYDRIRIVPFHVRIRGTALQNPHLDEELAVEQSGIFNFALAGLQELRAMKMFPVSAEGVEIIEHHREETDSVRAFCLSKLSVGSPSDFIASTELYQQYLNFCNLENNDISLSKNAFFQHFSSNFPMAQRTTRTTGTSRTRGYSGITNNKKS